MCAGDPRRDFFLRGAMLVDETDTYKQLCSGVGGIGFAAFRGSILAVTRFTRFFTRFVLHFPA